MVSFMISAVLFVTFTFAITCSAAPLDADKRLIRVPLQSDATVPAAPNPPPTAAATQTVSAAPKADSVVSTPKPAENSASTQAASEAPSLIYTGAKSRIDASNKDNGFVRVAYLKATTKALKVKIIRMHDGKEAANCVYDLNNKAYYESYPLQMGNGPYTIKVLENVSGNSYAVVQTQNITVKLSNTNAPYLVSTQYVNYSSAPQAVAKAAELCKGLDTELKKVTAIYKYVVENIAYDRNKAADVIAGKLNGYIPNVDSILNSKKGICFDYASLMGAMLRSQGIPTKLVMGYVSPNNVYHAWNEVYIKNVGWVKINSSIYFDGKSYSRMDSTFAAGNTSGARTEYIGNSKNYAKTSEY